MTARTRQALTLKPLTSGGVTSGGTEPVIVIDFLRVTSTPRLSTMLAEQERGHPVFAVDPAADLARAEAFVPLPELAAGYADAILSAAPAAERIVVVGYCAAAALALRIAARLAGSDAVGHLSGEESTAGRGSGNGGTAGHRPSEESTAGRGSGNGGTAGHRPSEESTAGRGSGNGGTAGHRPSEESTAGRGSGNGGTAGHRPSEESTAGRGSGNGGTAGHRPSEESTAGHLSGGKSRVRAILAQPTWPDTAMISADMAAFRADLGVTDGPPADLTGDPGTTLGRLVHLLQADIHAMAIDRGLTQSAGVMKALADLLARYRAWLGFLLASRAVLDRPWHPGMPVDVLAGTSSPAAVPWLRPGSYAVTRLSLPDGEHPATALLARSAMTLADSRPSGAPLAGTTPRGAPLAGTTPRGAPLPEPHPTATLPEADPWTSI